MVALEINEIGTLLNQMLKGTLFDHFLLQETEIRQAITYHIDGHISTDYYTGEELTAMHLPDCRYIPFSHVRPIVFEFMKGKRKPSYFKFIFLLSPENQAKTIAKSGCHFRTEDVTGMFLNLTYKNNRLICTTGISYHTFTMDKSLEIQWDRLASMFFCKNGIPVEKNS